MIRKLLLFGCLILACFGAICLWISVGWRPVYPGATSVPTVTHAAAPPSSVAAVERARQLVREEVARTNVPGLSVAVGAGGNLVWAEGFGYSHLETKLPVTPDTRFRIGTGSALLTSAAVGVLLERGNLSLDSEIHGLVPQFPKKQWPLTLRHLMANMGGLEREKDDDSPLYRQRCQQPAEALPHFAQNPLAFQPGTRYQPSNYGWVAVSAAIEAAAGQPFLQFMREQIFQPLGMGHTGAESPTEENPEAIGEEGEDPPLFTFIRQVILTPIGLAGAVPPPENAPATLYLSGFGPSPDVRHGVHRMRVGNLSCYAGSMAFYATPSDLVRFGLALQESKLLQPPTVRTLQAPQRLSSGQETGYGLGWTLDAGNLVGHDGELRGQRLMSLRMSRHPGIVVTVMSNSPSINTAVLTRKIAAAFAPPAR